MENSSEIIIFQKEDGTPAVNVTFANETVWLNQYQIETLFQTDRTSIVKHIQKIYESGELQEEGTCAIFAQVQKEGAREVTRQVKFYNLDMIISVGYRVQSNIATQFRIWATQRLRDYIIKGFALNDERFKSGSSMNYFRELLDRIRDIRLSEKVFYQQIKDIYATSIDYDPMEETTLCFFKEVQNKLLWAVSGKTAAELIYYRANATLPQMGLTSTKEPQKVRKTDIEIGKNYLNEDEIAMLKVIVEQYLAFAEAQALAHKPMYMKDWMDRLGLILTMNEKNILSHAGRISHELAMKKADAEYQKYRDEQKQIERLESIKELDADMKRLKNYTNGEEE
ncbi:MAG: virulence RhuM family protein [Bacteroidales bacterium]